MRWGSPQAGESAGRGIGLHKAWKMARVWCGFEDARLHDCRHFFATYAVTEGASLYLVGKVLGAYRRARLSGTGMSPITRQAQGGSFRAGSVGERDGPPIEGHQDRRKNGPANHDGP